MSFQETEIAPQLEEIVVQSENEKGPPMTSITRNEIRKSKTRLKSYFKRCKDALIGIHSEDTCPITNTEQASTSWYLDDDESVLNGKDTIKSEIYETEKTLIISNTGNTETSEVLSTTEIGQKNISKDSKKKSDLHLNNAKNIHLNHNNKRQEINGKSCNENSEENNAFGNLQSSTQLTLSNVHRVSDGSIEVSDSLKNCFLHICNSKFTKKVMLGSSKLVYTK